MSEEKIICAKCNVPLELSLIHISVKVDFEQLPEYRTQLEAMLPDSIEIHEGIPNIFLKWPHHKGQDTREIMPKASHVVEGSFYSTREMCIRDRSIPSMWTPILWRAAPLRL